MSNSRRILSLLHLGWLLVALVACSTSKAACEFSIPEGWLRENSRWDGDCVAGYAEGLGVLKEYNGSNVRRWFYGSVKHGEIEIGVIDQADGYVAGKFAKGQVLPSEDRQVYINAFNQAEQAANLASSRYKQTGNTASSLFYENKARELAEQMD